jgi:hypothetical protein
MWDGMEIIWNWVFQAQVVVFRQPVKPKVRDIITTHTSKVSPWDLTPRGDDLQHFHERRRCGQTPRVYQKPFSCMRWSGSSEMELMDTSRRDRDSLHLRTELLDQEWEICVCVSNE